MCLYTVLQLLYLAQPCPEGCCHLSCTDLGLNFHPCVLQITAYNRRTFETARHNLVINIMATEGKRRQCEGLELGRDQTVRDFPD